MTDAPVTDFADLAVIDDASVAAALLDPLRAQVLVALAEPGSATTVAAALGLTRQQVNYHLRALESKGLVTEVGTRQRRGLVERLVRATASGYVVSPAVLGQLAADPARTDRLSARYLVALAARAVREVGALMRAATTAGKQLPTLSVDADLRFRRRGNQVCVHRRAGRERARAGRQVPRRIDRGRTVAPPRRRRLSEAP